MPPAARIFCQDGPGFCADFAGKTAAIIEEAD
jgi:hypothetical protein